MTLQFCIIQYTLYTISNLFHQKFPEPLDSMLLNAFVEIIKSFGQSLLLQCIYCLNCLLMKLCCYKIIVNAFDISGKQELQTKTLSTQPPWIMFAAAHCHPPLFCFFSRILALNECTSAFEFVTTLAIFTSLYRLILPIHCLFSLSSYFYVLPDYKL